MWSCSIGQIIRVLILPLPFLKVSGPWGEPGLVSSVLIGMELPSPPLIAFVGPDVRYSTCYAGLNTAADVFAVNRLGEVSGL